VRRWWTLTKQPGQTSQAAVRPFVGATEGQAWTRTWRCRPCLGQATTLWPRPWWPTDPARFRIPTPRCTKRPLTGVPQDQGPFQHVVTGWPGAGRQTTS